MFLAGWKRNFFGELQLTKNFSKDFSHLVDCYRNIAVSTTVSIVNCVNCKVQNLLFKRRGFYSLIINKRELIC